MDISYAELALLAGIAGAILKLLDKGWNWVEGSFDQDKRDSTQDIDIAVIHKDIDFIKSQVSNHLPTSIKEVNNKLDRHIESQSEFEKQILINLTKLQR